IIPESDINGAISGVLLGVIFDPDKEIHHLQPGCEKTGGDHIRQASIKKVSQIMVFFTEIG
ncbi:MAG TPA: hypothetical protein PK040_02325, partial [Anaerolineaceae bacterium]|nr:hypothetical protein [Anaerolineaceae bacterium]